MREFSYEDIKDEVVRGKQAALRTVSRTGNAPRKTGMTTKLEITANAIKRFIAGRGNHITVDGLSVSISAAAGSYFGLRSVDMTELKLLINKLASEVFVDFNERLAEAITAYVPPTANSPNRRRFTGWK